MLVPSVLLGLSLAASPVHRVGPALATAQLGEPPAPPVQAAGPASGALPPRFRVRRSVALLSLSVPTLATGAALVVLRTRSLDRHVGSCELGLDQPLCTESAILANAHGGAAGAGLLGAGLGLIATGVTAAVPVRRRAWIAEAIVGGAALAVGAVWLGASSLAYGRDVAGDYVARVGPWFDRRAGAAALLGAGIGLSLGAGVGLLPPRGARRTAWTPTLGPTGVGLVARF